MSERHVSRRDLLRAAPLMAGQGGRPAAKPNILWILAEDMSPQLGCYGEPLIQTPVLDRFAREGVRFERAYCTAPVCSASRSALITGMFQTSIGAHNHRTIFKKPLPEGVRPVTHRLREAGYFTVLAGPAAPHGTPKTDFNFLADKVFDGSDWSQRPAGMPFFAQLTIQESHKGRGWPLGRKLTPRIEQAKLKLPPYWPDHPVARDEYANYLEAIQLVDRYVGDVLARLEKEGLAENTLVFFLGDNGSCTFRGKQFLYDGGIRIPMMARWPGRLAAGTVRTDLVSSLDVTAATLAAAGIPIPDGLHGRDFLSDRTPRRMELFAARDRCDTAIERIRCVFDSRYKYIRNFLPGIPYMQANPYKEREYPTWNLVKQLHREAKLTPEQALFAAESKPVEELYDLQDDPHEVRNLAVEAAQRDRLLTMRRRLDAWMAETKDRGGEMEDPVPIYEDYYRKRG